MTAIPVKPFRLQAVVFDFDGTLTAPGSLDWDAMRKAVGCPGGTPVLEYIDQLQDPQQKATAMTVLADFEMAAAAVSHPNTGAEAAVAALKLRGIPVGIVSRNCQASIERALTHFLRFGPGDFDVVISRDDSVAPKPHPDSVLMAAARLGVDPGGVLMVGDFRFDMQAGRSAGAVSVFLTNGAPAAEAPPEADYCISHLEELFRVASFGLPLAAGKLPNDLLEAFFQALPPSPPELLIQPGVGEDVAAVLRRTNDDVLLLKSDPITFATDAIGFYAVSVNANDIATAGGVPRWFLATLLLPPGTTPAAAWQTLEELQEACRRLGVSLCGGHTEITDAVSRPVVCGMLAGTAHRDRLVQKKRMQSGDRVILTKGIALEGTAIIAREFADRLWASGVDAADIDRARGFLNDISVVAEAGLAASFSAVSGMHDVTEGGLATALEELSIAGGHRIAVDCDKIPVLPETERICRHLNINPLGLIGSGSLLICCRPAGSSALLEALHREGTAAAVIGRLAAPGRGIEARRNGRPAPWPKFEVDEITRLF